MLRAARTSGHSACTSGHEALKTSLLRGCPGTAYAPLLAPSPCAPLCVSKGCEGWALVRGAGPGRRRGVALTRCSLGAQSDTHVILASLKRAPSELSSYTQKVFKVDDHLGIATAGLAADGRILCRYMRNECINHRRAYH